MSNEERLLLYFPTKNAGSLKLYTVFGMLNSLLVTLGIYLKFHVFKLIC